MIRERNIEAYYRERLEEIGGLTRKFVSPGRRGVPDQISVIIGVPVFLAEIKKPGEEPTKQQLLEHAEWRERGVTVYVLDSFDAVDEMIESLIKRAAFGTVPYYPLDETR